MLVVACGDKEAWLGDSTNIMPLSWFNDKELI